jgi:amino-acid N-acetyltransferase
MNPPPDIRRAGTADLPRITSLLERVGLPTADLGSIQQLEVWLLEENDTLVGAIALERYGSEALLRSFAVVPEYRKHGFGSTLVDRVEVDALADGVKRLVLLTETAEPFFRRRGYEITERSAVSNAVRESAEFRSLCPSSARCLSKSLVPSS